MFERRRLGIVASLIVGLAAALPVPFASAAGPLPGGSMPEGAVPPTPRPDLVAAGRRAADRAAYHDRLIVTWRGLAPATVDVAGVRSQDSTSRPMRSVVQARAGAAVDVAARLRRDPRVLSVVPDARLTLTDWPAGAPDDPYYPEQVDLAQIGVPEAWTTTTGNPSVVVAVIDTGIDLAHPDLDGVPLTAARNVVWNNGDVHDDVGHGTWVAGTILAETDNAQGVAGVAPDVTLMPIKIADDDGWISLSDALDAVDWAREHGADIINMSFGGWLSLEQVELGQPTFTTAREAGILMVAASGNDGMPARNYPASFRGVVSVGAVDAADELAWFSTTGKALDIVAPGVDLWSTVPDGQYELGSGTSGASPLVAGVASLVLAARPGLDVTELEAVLRASTVDLGVPGRDPEYGDGRIDAAAALVEPVPDPLPDLEPPAPLPELTLSFLDPATAVVQSGSRYTVRIEVNHDIVDGYGYLGDWRINAGKCDYRHGGDYRDLAFATEIRLTHLHQGHCYRVIVLAVDEDGSYAEAVSRPIKVVDPVAPTILRRRPAPGARGVDRSANVRIRFSERMVIPSGSVRLRNLDTGLTVRVATRWVTSSRTLVLDPALRMYSRTRYRVEVSGKVQDRKGNPVGARSWVFKTGR